MGFLLGLVLSLLGLVLSSLVGKLVFFFRNKNENILVCHHNFQCVSYITNLSLVVDYINIEYISYLGTMMAYIIKSFSSPTQYIEKKITINSEQ